MKLRSLLILILFSMQVAVSARAATAEPVPFDSRFRTGRLPNGITYCIQTNDLPRGQMHFQMVQKPGREPFFSRILTAPSGVEEGVAMLVRALQEQRVTSPATYRPHLLGIILVGSFQADTALAVIIRELSVLPASVDVMQAQEVPQGIDSTLAARAFSAKPLPPVFQDGYPRIEISFTMPELSREMRGGGGYYVMDFMRRTMEYVAAQSLDYPSCVYSGKEFVWAARAHPDSLTGYFIDLSRQCVQLARNGITDQLFVQARESYLKQEEWRYRNRNTFTNEYYVQECINHFFDGIPLPTAEWRYRFVNQMSSYITTEHVNRFIKGVLFSCPPEITLYKAANATDSLLRPALFLSGELLEERDRLISELSGLLFPFDDTYLSELASRILDIDLRLQLDSLERSRVIPVVTPDSLEQLFRQVWHHPEPVSGKAFAGHKPGQFARLPEGGKVERQMNTAHNGVSVWQLSGGSLLYVRPDTLLRGKICFAAVERDPTFFMPFVPREVFRKGSGPLLWKQTTQGLLLYNTTTPDSLRSFIEAAARQTAWLVLDSTAIHSLWKEREKQVLAARDLSRNILLDTLKSLLFLRDPAEGPQPPRGFDFICTGDICPDSLIVLAEEFLAGIPNRDLRAREPLTRGDGIRRGLHDQTISFPNPASESKTARLYSGPCPYTLEQYVLLQMLERLVLQATDHAASVQAALEYYPRGHYFLYIGFSSYAPDFAYNQHRLEQILADLAAYGPSADQLEQARHSLLMEHQAQLAYPLFHCRMLVSYSRSGRDFVTGYAGTLQHTDIAMVRDFVRQIMEYGNTSRVVLSGATNKAEDTSYSKNL